MGYTKKADREIEADEPQFKCYRVATFEGVTLFEHENYSICNSWIINNGVQGVRPKAVYE